MIISVRLHKDLQHYSDVMQRKAKMLSCLISAIQSEFLVSFYSFRFRFETVQPEWRLETQNIWNCMENGEMEMELDQSVSLSYGYQISNTDIWYESETMLTDVLIKKMLWNQHDTRHPDLSTLSCKWPDDMKWQRLGHVSWWMLASKAKQTARFAAISRGETTAFVPSK